MNRVLGYSCAHVGQTEPENGEINALQTKNSKFVPINWWSETDHDSSWSRRLPTILNLYE